LLGDEGVRRLLNQDAVALAQPFPYLTDGLVRLLGCAENLVDPGFEVGGPGIDTEMLTMPESMLSVTCVLILLG